MPKTRSILTLLLLSLIYNDINTTLFNNALLILEQTIRSFNKILTVYLNYRFVIQGVKKLESYGKTVKDIQIF